MIREEKLYTNAQTTSNQTQIELLKKHFPNCFDKNGAFMPHKMAEVVGDNELSLSRESYSLNWLGKAYARVLAHETPLTFLKEDEAHNQKEVHKKSENILIKGDNLEVLKHLRNAYAESIKMIYIDPPYNTGGDGFVYNDDRKFTPEQLMRLAGIELDEAKRILEFTRSKANSHSAWLTFMYPRLYIARELLKDEGVIFISIDDNEQAQLKLLCDEVFGEENFVAELTWEKKKKGTFLSNSLTNIKESILVYAKSIQFFKGLIGEINTEIETYPCINSSNKRELRTIPKGIKSKFKQANYFLPKGSEISDTTMSLILHSDLKIQDNILIDDVLIEGNWRYAQVNIDEYASQDNLYITQDLYIRRIVHEARNKTLKDLLLRKGTDQKLSYKDFNPNNLFEDGWGSNEDGEEEVRLLLNKDVFTNPKPVKLIKKFITSVRDDNMIILDFFAGSGTTAHAVMDLNAKDGGQRKYICVQLPEQTDTKKEAHKAGYNTIFDITKARIEKAAEKIRTEASLLTQELDLGFKVFETEPLFEGYGEEVETLEQGSTLFDGSKLGEEALQTLLTTWKLYDGLSLTTPTQRVMLAEYTAYKSGKNLYIMHQGFDINAIKALICNLDDEATFNASKIILFGYNVLSTTQRELHEALQNYTNKKSIELDVVVRY